MILLESFAALIEALINRSAMIRPSMVSLPARYENPKKDEAAVQIKWDGEGFAVFLEPQKTFTYP